MQLFHLNLEAVRPDDAFEAMMGSRNGEGLALFRRLMGEGAYQKVAEMGGRDPETFWRVTQNGVDGVQSWVLAGHEGLRPVDHGPRGRRSSMMGDIVVVGFVEIGPTPAGD